MIEKIALAAAVVGVIIAVVQLRSANQALDANNAFLVETRLLDLQIDALGAVEAANQSAGVPEAHIVNAFRRYQATLVTAKTLSDNGGLGRGTWNSILDAQCKIFEGNFDFLPILETECSARQ